MFLIELYFGFFQTFKDTKKTKYKPKKLKYNSKKNVHTYI